MGPWLSFDSLFIDVNMNESEVMGILIWRNDTVGRFFT